MGTRLTHTARMESRIAKAEELLNQITSLQQPMSFKQRQEVVKKLRVVQSALMSVRMPVRYKEFLEKSMQHLKWSFAFQNLLIRELEELLSGSSVRQNLAITTPPRHGKTTTITIPLPAYKMIYWPGSEVIAATHSQGLANFNSRHTRRIVQEHIGVSTENVQDWEAKNGSKYKCIGVGGYLPGRGGNLIVADDLTPSRKHAESPVFRESLRGWWESDLITRRNPGQPCPVIMITCMTGDTPVLMGDGTEQSLRDIQIGDSVATYENGKLTTAKVVKYKNNGPDFVYKITMTSGRIVRANARHPFLVFEHGKFKWIRVKNLTTDHTIVALRGSGVNGRARSAWPRGVASQPYQGATAVGITTKKNGQTGIAHHLNYVPKSGEIENSSIATELLVKNTMPCLRRKKACVPFAKNRPEKTSGLIGAANSALITTTPLIKSDHFSATTAISPLVIPKSNPRPLPLPSTSDFTVDKIESIQPDSAEEVFDVQIERTENFIANGLVSHNTRWHPEDLWASVVDPATWKILRLPAICDYSPDDPDEFCRIPDPLGRQPGDVLCPGLWDGAALQAIRAQISEYTWLSLYQGRPAWRDGLFFEVRKFDKRPYTEEIKRRVRFFDLAASDEPDACYTASVRMAMGRDGRYIIEHIDRIQAGPAQRDAWQRRLAQQDHANGGFEVAQCEELQPGAAGKDRARNFARLMSGFKHAVQAATGDKVTRADPYAAHVGAGLIHLPDKDCFGADQKKRIADFMTEHSQFPLSSSKDYVDAASGAFSYLNRRRLDMLTSRSLDNSAVDLTYPPGMWGRKPKGFHRSGRHL